MNPSQENHLQFFTAVCHDWLHLLSVKDCADVVLRALRYRSQTKQVSIAAFVIMPNHIHLIWRITAGVSPAAFQRDFLKITAKQIIDILQRQEHALLPKITVNLADRKHQVWKRNSLSVDLYTEAFLLQKLLYIHKNPCQQLWNLSVVPEEYTNSSARFYMYGSNDFGFLTHYKDL